MSNKSIAEQIAELHTLKVSGVLSEDEFSRAKGRLLNDSGDENTMSFKKYCTVCNTSVMQNMLKCPQCGSFQFTFSRLNDSLLNDSYAKTTSRPTDQEINRVVFFYIVSSTIAIVSVIIDNVYLFINKMFKESAWVIENIPAEMFDSKNIFIASGFWIIGFLSLSSNLAALFSGRYSNGWLNSAFHKNGMTFSWYNLHNPFRKETAADSTSISAFKYGIFSFRLCTFVVGGILTLSNYILTDLIRYNYTGGFLGIIYPLTLWSFLVILWNISVINAIMLYDRSRREYVPAKYENNGKDIFSTILLLVILICVCDLISNLLGLPGIFWRALVESFL